jgi:rubrerythrin
MKVHQKITVAVLFVLLIIIVLLVRATYAPAPGVEQKIKTSVVPTKSVDEGLSQDEIEAMNTALEQEYRMNAIFDVIVKKYGQAVPFDRIVTPAFRNSTAIIQIYQVNSLKVPIAPATAVAAPESFSQACEMAMAQVDENIRMYESYLTSVRHAQVRAVFTSNLQKARDKHLPALKQCSSTP